MECVDSGSYERNLPYDEVERRLFLFTEHEMNVTDPSCESDDVQILSVNVSDRIYSILKQKVDQIDCINDMQKERFYRVFRENIKVFSDKIVLCTEYTHEFQVINPTPYTHNCRNVPLAMLEKTGQSIQKMLRENIIKESDSEYANALCFVEKADGSVRVTIEAYNINSMTMSNHYRNEPVQAQINKVNSAKWYTIVDLTQAFLQVPLNEHCRQYTAFLHRGKRYRFIRTPFELASSGAALARGLDKMLGEDLNDCVAWYADDANVFF